MEYLNINTKQRNIQFYLRKFSDLVFDAVVNSEWVEGVLEILSGFEQSILVTATPQDEIEKIIEKLEIGKFFKKIYGSPDTKIQSVENTLKSKEKNKPTPKDQQLKAAENIERLLSPLVREVVRRKWQKRIM